MNKTIIYNLNDLPEIVAELKDLMQTHRIFAFTGSLGAGKTTLVRSLLQAWGVTGVISSPTFTYVNIYTVQAHPEHSLKPQEILKQVQDDTMQNRECLSAADPARPPKPWQNRKPVEGLAGIKNKFYHFDLYRITDVQEFIDAGFDEYLTDPQAIILIEWPEVIMPLLKHNVCFISLEYVSEDQRSIAISRN